MRVIQKNDVIIESLIDMLNVSFWNRLKHNLRFECQSKLPWQTKSLEYESYYSSCFVDIKYWKFHIEMAQ